MIHKKWKFFDAEKCSIVLRIYFWFYFYHLGYVPPHRITVARRLKRLNRFYQQQLQKEMLSIDRLSITLDFWSNRAMKSFLCITGHYLMHEFNYKSKILSFNAFYDRHQGVRIAKIVKEKLNYLNVLNKLQSITTDGARNMVTMYQHLKNNDFDWIWCVAHRLHLVVTKGLSFWFNETKKNDGNSSSNDSSSNKNGNSNNSSRTNHNNNNDSTNTTINIHNNNNINENNSNNISDGLNSINSFGENDDEDIWDDATQGKT